MICKFDKRLLTQYSDGELSHVMQIQVRTHVNTCPDCAYDLHILTSAVTHMRSDAGQPMPVMPDLYAGFRQRIATQTSEFDFARDRKRRLWMWPLAGIVVPVACVLTISLALFPIISSHQYNLLHPGYLDIVASALSETYDGPLNTTVTLYNTAPKRLIWTTTAWNFQGYNVETGSADTPNIKKDPLTHQWIVKYTDQQFSSFSTPTGVQLSWDKPVDTRAADNEITLFAHLKDPADRPANRGLFFLNQIRSVLNLLTAANDSYKANTEMAEEMTKEGPCRKITLKHINTALGRRSQAAERTAVAQSNSDIKLKVTNLSLPDTIEVWINSDSRICREKAYYIDSNGMPCMTDAKLNYIDRVPASIQVSPSGNLSPDLPTGSPAVLGRYSLNANGINKSMSTEQHIDLSWLTMSEADKKQVQDVVARFAHAWKEHDETALRALTDVTWPLEITRPDKRKRLTEANVWQHVWQNPLSKEPHWKDYQIAFDFAYSYQKHLLDSPPLDAAKIDCDIALPGLNVLAWVKARRPDGNLTSFSAHLYLVKRSGDWKIYQFVRNDQ